MSKPTSKDRISVSLAGFQAEAEGARGILALLAVVFVLCLGKTMPKQAGKGGLLVLFLILGRWAGLF